MDNMVLPKNHYSITIANDVAEICNPLFEKYSICAFLYARVFDNGTAYPLISHHEWHEHHFKKGYMITPPIPPKFITNKFYYLLTGNEPGPFQEILYDLRNLFGLWYPICLIERYYGFYDLFMFFTTPENHNIINFYINNIDVLEKFKFYFKEKANKLIIKSEKNKLIIPEHMRPNFGGLKKPFNSIDTDKQKFLEQINVNRYILSSYGKEVFFTKREIDSLKCLGRGRTVKEAAKLMRISPRTVEDYINSIKCKLGLRRKSEIIDAISRKDLLIL